MRLVRRQDMVQQQSGWRFKALGAGDEAREMTGLAILLGLARFKALGAGDEAREVPGKA